MNWRFLTKPKWVLGHLIIIGFVVLFVNLGLWQLHRLHGRVAANNSIRSAMAAPPLQITSAQLPAGARGFRNVEVDGTWQDDHTVYVRYPLQDGAQGYYVLTPVKLASGDSVVVNRGWIPLDRGRVAAMAGESDTPVQVVGLLRDTEEAHGAIGHNDATPAIPTITAVDISKLKSVMGLGSLAREWIQLRTPAATTDPRPLDAPALDKGPHFSYMLQWFSFCGIAILGWAAVLYRAGRDVNGDRPS